MEAEDVVSLLIPLRSALVEIENGSPVDALTTLLATWRTRSVPELADAIDLLSDRIAQTLPPIGRTEAAWLAVAKLGHTADMTALAARLRQGTLQVRADRLAAIMRRPRDPRLTGALVEIVTGSTLANNLATFPIWGRIFDAFRELADERAREPLLVCQQKLPKDKTTRFDRMFAKGVSSVLQALPVLSSSLSLSPAERKVVHDVMSAIRAMPASCFEEFASTLARERDAAHQVNRAAVVTEADLLAAIYADPASDAPRHVYADWLLEKDDPRGSFIALQLQQDSLHLRADAEVRRLLALYERVWLGAARTVVELSTASYRRGFLAYAKLRFPSDEKKRARLAALPIWRTLEEARGDVLPVLSSPENRALRRVTVTSEVLPEIFALPHSTYLTEISVLGTPSGVVAETQPIEKKTGLAALPDLRRVNLVMTGDGQMCTLERLRWLTEHPVFAQLERLDLRASSTLRPFALGTWMTWFGARSTSLRELRLADGHHPLMILRRRVGEAVRDGDLLRRRPHLELGINLVKGTDEGVLVSLLESAPRTGWTLRIVPSRDANMTHAALHKRLTKRLAHFVHAPLADPW